MSDADIMWAAPQMLDLQRFYRQPGSSMLFYDRNGDEPPEYHDALGSLSECGSLDDVIKVTCDMCAIPEDDRDNPRNAPVKKFAAKLWRRSRNNLQETALDEPQARGR